MVGSLLSALYALPGWTLYVGICLGVAIVVSVVMELLEGRDDE